MEARTRERLDSIFHHFSQLVRPDLGDLPSTHAFHMAYTQALHETFETEREDKDLIRRLLKVPGAWTREGRMLRSQTFQDELNNAIVKDSVVEPNKPSALKKVFGCEQAKVKEHEGTPLYEALEKAGLEPSLFPGSFNVRYPGKGTNQRTNHWVTWSYLAIKPYSRTDSLPKDTDVYRYMNSKWRGKRLGGDGGLRKYKGFEDAGHEVVDRWVECERELYMAKELFSKVRSVTLLRVIESRVRENEFDRRKKKGAYRRQERQFLDDVGGGKKKWYRLKLIDGRLDWEFVEEEEPEALEELESLGEGGEE